MERVGHRHDPLRGDTLRPDLCRHLGIGVSRVRDTPRPQLRERLRTTGGRSEELAPEGIRLELSRLGRRVGESVDEVGPFISRAVPGLLGLGATVDPFHAPANFTLGRSHRDGERQLAHRSPLGVRWPGSRTQRDGVDTAPLRARHHPRRTRGHERRGATVAGIELALARRGQPGSGATFAMPFRARRHGHPRMESVCARSLRVHGANAVNVVMGCTLGWRDEGHVERGGSVMPR